VWPEAALFSCLYTDYSPSLLEDQVRLLNVSSVVAGAWGIYIFRLPIKGKRDAKESGLPI
jgi:hypothetical protein